MKPKKTRRAMTRRLPLVSPAPPAFDPQMWFNPEVPLDTSQVIDDRYGLNKVLGFQPLPAVIQESPFANKQGGRREKGGRKRYGR